MTRVLAPRKTALGPRGGIVDVHACTPTTPCDIVMLLHCGFAVK